jgi:hypothetical protein
MVRWAWKGGLSSCVVCRFFSPLRGGGVGAVVTPGDGCLPALETNILLHLTEVLC